MFEGHLESILKMIYTNPNYPISDELYNKVIEYQLKNHPEFEIGE